MSWSGWNKPIWGKCDTPSSSFPGVTVRRLGPYSGRHTRPCVIELPPWRLPETGVLETGGFLPVRSPDDESLSLLPLGSYGRTRIAKFADPLNSVGSAPYHPHPHGERDGRGEGVEQVGARLHEHVNSTPSLFLGEQGYWTTYALSVRPRPPDRRSRWWPTAPFPSAPTLAHPPSERILGAAVTRGALAGSEGPSPTPCPRPGRGGALSATRLG